MDFGMLNDALVAATGEISGFMYTYILVFLLVIVGVWFSVRTKFVQIRYIKDMFTQLTEKKHVKGERSISSFQALMVSTASRVGTGNIAGIATAIATGGPGAVFWMWLMAIIGAASAFVESTLAQIWKVRGADGEFRGGPAYYIQQALGKRWLGIVFAVALILCFAFGFNGLQSYNMASALEYYIPDYATNGCAIALGIVLAVMTAFVIFGGAKRISIITSVIVPVMALAYIALAVWTTVTNLGEIPAVFSLIFASAFDFQSIFGGFAGSVIMLGIKRGLFSNEAGSGSAPCAAAAAECDDPVKMGLVQALGVLVDTIVICSCTAFVMLLAPESVTAGLTGMDLLQAAVQYHLGSFGVIFIAVMLALFSFSTFIGILFYARSNVAYLFGDRWLWQTLYKVLALGMLLVGGVQAYTVVWDLGDVGIGLMTIFNMIALYPLSGEVMDALNDYEKRKKLQ